MFERSRGEICLIIRTIGSVGVMSDRVGLLGLLVCVGVMSDREGKQALELSRGV